jgi:hypothetical protein
MRPDLLSVLTNLLRATRALGERLDQMEQEQCRRQVQLCLAMEALSEGRSPMPVQGSVEEKARNRAKASAKASARHQRLPEPN